MNRVEGTNWSTPFVWENERRTEIVTSGSDKVRSYDLSGKLLWEFSGMSTISIPTPFDRNGLLYLAPGYLATRFGRRTPSGPAPRATSRSNPMRPSNDFIVWSARTGAPYNPTPLVYGDYYYTLFDRGFFTSHDAKTGKEIYGRQRITADASGFTASPWAYNGKIFAMSEDGDTYVIQAGPEFKVHRQELPQRDDAGYARGGARQSARTNRIEALSHFEEDAIAKAQRADAPRKSFPS